MTGRIPVSRRRFLTTAAASTAVSAVNGIGKPYLSRAADRPLITHGIQSGDVSTDSAVIWARADRPARMLAEVATSDSFKTIERAVFVGARLAARHYGRRGHDVSDSRGRRRGGARRPGAASRHRGVTDSCNCRDRR